MSTEVHVMIYAETFYSMHPCNFKCQYNMYLLVTTTFATKYITFAFEEDSKSSHSLKEKTTTCKLPKETSVKKTSSRPIDQMKTLGLKNFY